MTGTLIYGCLVVQALNALVLGYGVGAGIGDWGGYSMSLLVSALVAYSTHLLIESEKADIMKTWKPQSSDLGGMFGDEPTPQTQAPLSLPAPAPPAPVQRIYEPRTRARRGGPETSAAAAEFIAGDPAALRDKQKAVLNILKDAGKAGLTDEELHRECIRLHGWRGQSTARTRRCELVELGLVEDTGERREVASGLKGRVWRAK